MNGYYWIYLIMLGFLLGYQFAKTNEQRRLTYYSACFFLILMFAAQNYSISSDTPEYMRQYALIPTLSFGEMLTHKFEIGYVLLSRLVEALFRSDRVLLVALIVMIMVPYCRSFEKEMENPMIALMAFLALGMYMHAIIFWRQLAAMALLTFSYRYLRERKFLPFLLVVLAAMSFHKTAVVFVGLYIIYKIPINKWLLIACAGIAVVFGFFGNTIIDIGIALVYPKYAEFPRLVLGGETLLALCWVITLLSFWVFHDRFDDDRIRLPFLMILTAATIQPICFAFYNWLRIVLYFRVGLVAMTAQLYAALFETKDNAVTRLLSRICPRLYGFVIGLYDKKWFPVAMQLVLFAVLFVWYHSELEGAQYVMAPIYPKGMEIPAGWQNITQLPEGW